ncbi:MAG: T9SS type A sorting domain-containing protein [Ignavibacteriae bacterium]|nr:T9SS type A sorting domain-containing protein [Ignavibacteriota bacterium]
MRPLVICAAILLLMSSGAFGQSYDMKIHLKSGQTITVPIDSVARMSFAQITGFQAAGTSSYAPTAFRLLQNYPNPFNPSTTIVYETTGSSDVRVRIFDTRGALIRDLLHEGQSSGLHHVVWDGMDNSRAHVASGVYISVVQCGGHVLSRTMILMK